MKSSKPLFLAGTVVSLCVLATFLTTTVGQSRRTYELETQVYTTPEYRTDAARAIDAYERLMERHMDMTERNLAGVSADVATVVVKLDAIDARLAKLDTRLARIEKHLGIAPAIPAPPDPNRLPAAVPGATPSSQSRVDSQW